MSYIYIKCGSYSLVVLMYLFISNVVCECDFECKFAFSVAPRGKKLNTALNLASTCPDPRPLLVVFQYTTDTCFGYTLHCSRPWSARRLVQVGVWEVGGLHTYAGTHWLKLTCSVQDGIYALGKAHMRSTPSLGSFSQRCHITGKCAEGSERSIHSYSTFFLQVQFSEAALIKACVNR